MGESKHVQIVDMHQFHYALDFSAESKVPFCVWGIKAVGKTQGVYQWCDKRGYRCVVLHLATQDVVDLIGMMKVVPGDCDSEKVYSLFSKAISGKSLDHDEKEYITAYFKDGATTQSKTIWAKPEWLKNDGIKTCYFLDEFNRGNQFVLAAMLPFLIEGKIHTHKIGQDDFVVAACNPTTGNYNVNDSFEADDALRDRCGHLILEPSTDEFLAFAKNKIGRTTMKVLHKNTSYIEIKQFSMPFEVEPSRRSIINVMSHIDKKDAKWIKERACIILGIYLGSNFRDDWLSQYTERLEALDLFTLMNFDENEEIIKKTITTIVKGKEEVKNDIFEGAQDQIVGWLNNKYKDGIDNIDWLLKFFSIPVVQKDSIVSLLSKIITFNKPNLLVKILESNILDALDSIKEYKQNERILGNIS